MLVLSWTDYMVWRLLQHDIQLWLHDRGLCSISPTGTMPVTWLSRAVSHDVMWLACDVISLTFCPPESYRILRTQLESVWSILYAIIICLNYVVQSARTVFQLQLHWDVLSCWDVWAETSWNVVRVECINRVDSHGRNTCDWLRYVIRGARVSSSSSSSSSDSQWSRWPQHRSSHLTLHL